MRCLDTPAGSRLPRSSNAPTMVLGANGEGTALASSCRHRRRRQGSNGTRTGSATAVAPRQRSHRIRRHETGDSKPYSLCRLDGLVRGIRGTNTSFRMLGSTPQAQNYDRDGNESSGEWRSFEEAREYAQSLGFEFEEEGRKWLESEERPPDIPSSPDQVYKDKGWNSWGDFLGFPAVFWLRFEKARNYVWRIGLESRDEWWEWSKSGERPTVIPSNPDQFYKGEGWLSWSDFLGYRPAGEWRDFEEARDYARSLGLKSKEEWKEWSKSGDRPPDIPSEPDRVYKDEGWLSWGDFLGYRPAGEWRDFEEARDYARTLGLKSRDEWIEWSKSGERPPDIPFNPDRDYKGEGWLSWGDFLGYRPAGEWRDFEEARDYVRSLGLKSAKEWRECSKSGERPPDIPSHPDTVYKVEGWNGWPDFLGYRPAGEWRDFEEARDYARSLGLESEKEWREWSKSGERPLDIPSNPYRVYKGEVWLSWSDFLGYRPGYVAGEWRGFEEARDFARRLGLKSKDKWREWSKSGERPLDIPSEPHRVYKDEGWNGWGDFLGYGPAAE